MKFTSPGGQIHIDVERQTAAVELSVSDTGKGIDGAFLPHVFEPFRQADGSITRAHGGLGLGLSISRHLVELHGGRIRAESDGPGRGARFVVTLPIAPQTVGVTSQEPGAPAAAARATDPQQSAYAD